MKKFLSLIIIAACLLGTFVFAGCGGGKSADEVNALFDNVSQTYCKDSFLSVGVSAEKVVPSGSSIDTDKAYIFPLVYEKYLACTSGFVFDLAKRQGGKLIVDANGFSNKQCGEIYNTLEAFFNSLNVLAEEISVFEQSSGNLHYKELVEAYNRAVECSINLTTTYSALLFEHNSMDFSSTDKLTNNSVRNMIWSKLCSIAKVSFEYEVLNQTYELPYGEVLSWYNETETVSDICSLAAKTQNILKDSRDVMTRIPPEFLANTKDYLFNLLQSNAKFDREHALMKSASANINIKEYLSKKTEDDRNAYVSTLSQLQQSNIKIIENFMNTRFDGAFNGLSKIVSNLDN